MVFMSGPVRKTWMITAGLVLVVAVGSGARSQERPDAAPPVEEGRTLFLTYCSSCHGASATGDGPIADELRVPPANLTELAKKNNGAFLSERIQRVIDGRDRDVRAHGSMEMPVWGDAFKRRENLTEEAVKARIAAIVRYLQSMQQRAG